MTTIETAPTAPTDWDNPEYLDWLRRESPAMEAADRAEQAERERTGCPPSVANPDPDDDPFAE